MADNKSGPPWLLAVYTIALLMLVLGSLARYGDRPTRAQRNAEGTARPTVQRDNGGRTAARATRAPRPVAGGATSASSAVAVVLPSAGPARPASARPTDPGPAAMGPAPARPALAQVGGAPASEAAEPIFAFASPPIDDEADGFHAEVVGAPQSAAMGGRHRRTPAGYADRETTRKVLPWVTEGAVALILGITFGFLTRKEIIAMTAVAAVVGLGVAMLEYFGQTNIAWASLWHFNRDYVVAGMTENGLANIVQKGATVLLAAGGFLMGTKG